MKAIRVASLTLLGLLALLSAIPAAAQTGPPQPKEWTVPWERTRPRDPVMDQAGRVWFVGQGGNYVAYLDPTSGEFRKYEVEPGTNPHNVNLDERGGVWFTGNRNGRIVHLDPASGKLRNFMMPDSTIRDPHTMIWDRSGTAWFTAQQGGVVGRLERGSGEIRLWHTGRGSRPYGIVLNSRQQPWFDLFGTNRIGTIDPGSLELKQYPLPNERSRPRRIAITSDDAVWYGDYSRGFLGRLDPATGQVEEFAMPSGGSSLPYAMTVDDRDRLWLVETGVQPNRLVAFDAKSRNWVASIPIASNGAAANTVRHMTFDRRTRQIWFGTDAGTIGAIDVPTEMGSLTP